MDSLKIFNEILSFYSPFGMKFLVRNSSKWLWSWFLADKMQPFFFFVSKFFQDVFVEIGQRRTRIKGGMHRLGGENQEFHIKHLNPFFLIQYEENELTQILIFALLYGVSKGFKKS